MEKQIPMAQMIPFIKEILNTVGSYFSDYRNIRNTIPYYRFAVRLRKQLYDLSKKLDISFRPIRNENGQAMVEFGLILPLFVIVMMVMIIAYDLSASIIEKQEEIRYEMREKVDDIAPGKFTSIFIKRDVKVEIPGTMKKVFGKPFIRQEMTFSTYGGCYQGKNNSIYRKRYQYRSINY